MNMEDMISQQPDEILADVLSLLPIKEVGRSTVLSKRWRDLWRLTTRLNFDAPEELNKVQVSASRKRLLDSARSKYVTWVNEILKLHERPTLEEFRVQFDLDASATKDIDEWIKFAILKKAKKIEIDLTSYFRGDYYSPSRECLQNLKSVSNLPNVMCIRSLFLGQVNAAGELVGYLLSKCPQLEMLSLSSCHNFGKLKVAGPSLPLKYLNIHICLSLESIELCAPKLETFVYYGPRVNFVIGDNPLLSELHIGGVHLSNVVGSYLGQFSRYFSQLKTLLLKTFENELPEVDNLRNLNHLILDICVQYDVSLVPYKRFIMAAPSLTKLTLKITVDSPLKMDTQKHLIRPHECLKELEIIGYTGTSCMLEFAKYMTKVAINLEKMVLDSRHPFDGKRNPEHGEKVRRHADRLRRRLPAGAELDVIV